MIGGPPGTEGESAAVEVWLARPERMPDGLDAWLSPEERVRAARYRDAAASQGFIASRALLHRAAASIGGAVTWTRRGAPRIEHAGDVFVSASRTRGLVAIAVARGIRLGVDVERVRPGPAEGPLPASVLTAAEHELLDAPDQPDRRAAFFRFWARKESFAKALGIGVELPLSTVDVSWSADVGVARNRLGSYSIRDLDLGAEHVGAVATETPCDLRVHVLDDLEVPEADVALLSTGA